MIQADPATILDVAQEINNLNHGHEAAQSLVSMNLDSSEIIISDVLYIVLNIYMI